MTAAARDAVQPLARPRARSSRGSEREQPARVRMARAGRRCRRPMPSSTCRPAYITITRSATPATTPRSWVMSMIADVGALLDALEHVEHLRLDRHVERGGRLVGDEHVGVVGDRHRDHRPLAHAARELVRVLLGALRSDSGCRRCRAARPRASAARRSSTSWCTAIASAIWSPTRCTGFSAASASWNTIAIRFAAHRLQLPARTDRRGSRRRRSTSPRHARGRREQPEDRQRRDRLARARLADDPEGLGGLTRSKLTSSTACTTPSSVGNSTDRLRTDSTDSSPSVSAATCGSKASRRRRRGSSRRAP